jgi:AcrR family transcriptional regulator
MVSKRVKREYDNSTRAEQARETRHRIVEAARQAFVESGFDGTTVSTVADRAGVSVETIYKKFRSKGGLARVVLDTAIAGDDEPVAMPDRPAAKDIADAPDAREMLRRYAHHARGIYERLGPLTTILLGARYGNRELQELRQDADAQRLHAAGLLAGSVRRTGQLRNGLDDDHVRDAIWALNSPELHSLLTADRGWGADAYERFLTDCLTALLVGDRKASQWQDPQHSQ